MSLCIHGYELACDECAVAELPESRRLDRVHVEARAMLELLRRVAMMEHRINHQDCHCALCFAPAQARAIIARIDTED